MGSLMVQSLKANYGTDAAIQTYKILLISMKKQRQQLPITMFLKPIMDNQLEVPPEEHLSENTTAEAEEL